MEDGLRFRGRDMALKPRILKVIDPLLLIPFLLSFIIGISIVKYFMWLVIVSLIISELAGFSYHEMMRVIIRKFKRNNHIVICHLNTEQRNKNLVDQGFLDE